jgi:LemA protein
MGWIILAIIVLAVLFVIGLYNGLVTARNAYKNAFAQIDVQLTRRHDLIPNLVETVKGYAAHEKEIFESVAEARGRLAGATSPREAAAANAGLTAALGRLLAIAENYPNLKANENFIRLQDELAGTENRVATERMRYNDAVRLFNTSVKRYPAVFFARLFGFREREYFEAGPEAQQVPGVKF